MKKISSKYLLIFISSILVVGCVSLTPEAKQIYMVGNTQEISSCTRLGHVSAKSMACADPISCQNAAESVGRNKAAELGATHLTRTFSGINLTHGLFEGDAYRCEEGNVGVQRMELTSPLSHADGCAKDTECKGDRVCEKGQCISPSHQ